MHTLVYTTLFLFSSSCFSSGQDLEHVFALKSKDKSFAYIGDYKDLILGVLSARGSKNSPRYKIKSGLYKIRIKYVRYDEKKQKHYFFTPDLNEDPNQEQDNKELKPKYLIKKVSTYFDANLAYTAQLHKRIISLSNQFPYAVEHLQVTLEYSNGIERQASLVISNEVTNSKQDENGKKHTVITDFKFSHASGQANVIIGCALKPDQGAIAKLELILKKHPFFLPKGPEKLITFNFKQSVQRTRFALNVSLKKNKFYRYSNTKLNLDLICTSTKGIESKASISPVLKANH